MKLAKIKIINLFKEKSCKTVTIIKITTQAKEDISIEKFQKLEEFLKKL